MTHVIGESKLRSFVRSSMHQRIGKWVAIGGAVVYYALSARPFSAGINDLYCRTLIGDKRRRATCAQCNRLLGTSAVRHT